MNENRVLVWVTFTSIVSLLTLILMIVYGSINIDYTKFSDWLAPSTIATLIGGLGGALAGTWLSGRNATKQWEKQEVYRQKEQEKIVLNKKSVFNTLVYAELKNIEVNAILMIFELTVHSTLIDNAGENKSEVITLFNEYIEDISYSVRLIENAYKEAKALLQTDSIDYETFNNISNVRVRTYDFFILSDKHGHNIVSHLEVLEKSNPKHYEMVILQTMIGMNICRKTIIKLNEFFIEREKDYLQ